MSKPAEIVLIDDDVSFCQSAARVFQQNDMAPLTVSDPQIARSLNFASFKVILLDIDMPGISGLALLPDIRATSQPVIIMVSGHSDAETRVACLEGGADFFFPKPVDLAELSLVAMRAVGRRGTPTGDVGQWVLSGPECALHTPDGRNIGLSASEFRLLEQLFHQAPDPVSKECLTQVVTGDVNRAAAHARALEVMISRLRQRAGSGGVRLPVKALRNVGYVFHGAGVIGRD